MLGNFCSIAKGMHTLQQHDLFTHIRTILAHVDRLNSPRMVDILLWCLENFAIPPEGRERLLQQQVCWTLVNTLLLPYLQ